MMTTHPRDFWQALQTGIEVAVASSHAEKLLGIRDAFRDFFLHHLQQTVVVAVVPQGEGTDGHHGLTLSNEDTAALAERRATELFHQLGESYHFFVGSEGGLHALDQAGDPRYFVCNWTVVTGSVGKAFGSSSSVQLPARLIAGLDDEELPFAIPGTRRRGGMLNSLTAGLKNRRQAVYSATLNALSSLFYGILENGSPRRR